MKRCILLVDLFWTRSKDPRIPLGHASLLAALRAQDTLDVRSLVVAVNDTQHTPASIARTILQEVGDLDHGQVDVAFGAYVWGEELLQGTLRQLRARGFRGRIILGGPQISYSGEGLEALYPDADAFIRGYGEEALAALASSAEPQEVRGVHWAGAPDQKQQASVNLEALPSPWLTGTIPLKGQGFIRWETQRGCPFRCSFCQHREAGARLSRHALDLPRIEAEIDLFCASGVRSIAVLDPIFNAAPHAVEVLRRFAQRGFTGRLSLQCRAELITEAFLDAAAALDVCLEFGLQTVIPDEGRAVQRKNRIDRVDAALAGVRSRGLSHEVSLIFGLPLQTLRSFEESVTWCLERQVPVIKAFPLMLLRGTELDQERDRWGFVESDDVIPVVQQSNSFSRDDWHCMAQISEALQHTEGHHPSSWTELLAISHDLHADMARWTPSRAQQS